MTTPSREEAPERVLLPCPMCGRIDSDDNAVQESPINVTEFKAASGGLGYRVECSCGTSGPSARGADTASDNWNTRADIANREPSEGEVERGAIAMMKTGENQAVGRRLTSEFTDAEILAMTASAFKAWSER